MSTDNLLDLWREGITVAVAVAAPFLVAGLVVGLCVAVVQTATQLQESILAFVPKLLAALVVIAVAGHWSLDKLARYAQQAFTAQAESRPSPAGDVAVEPPLVRSTP
ncbi:MAG: flagellar biosynthetic protein FliQ [Deltaproteobacteria bacterium]|nr:flagellar biosynthetic protein FliQ [Deltaproteobacteria bacterium]MCW5804093.1 flagellar biosynthetic protein FliQ [Deltaproteobacteria bacterium]